ncbi:MAG: winged helix-turn-helix transcriptional regulator [Methanomassiliicoccales archaeon]|nr:MAG: winged helix-turn-helix transcriptional regulator [Methanomassiliicoccales archaeon]
MVNELCETTIIDKKSVEAIKKAMIERGTADRLAETFKALGDPTRIKIIYALSKKRLCVCDLSATLGMSQSAVSHQLRILRNLKLVKFEKKGKSVYYSLDDDHILSMFEKCVEHVNEQKER